MRPRRAPWKRSVEATTAVVETRVIDGGIVLLDIVAGPLPTAARLTPATARRLAINLLAAAYEGEIVGGLR